MLVDFGLGPDFPTKMAYPTAATKLWQPARDGF